MFPSYQPFMNHFHPIFKRPQWIFFDLDDTLWDFAANSLKSLRHVFDNFREVSDKFDSFNDFIDVYHFYNSRMWELHAQGKVTSGFLKTERWRLTLFPESDIATTREICAKVNAAYLENLATQPGIAKDAVEVLTSLSKAFMTGIISNGFTDTQYKKLFNSGLWRFVARTVISDEIGIQKPDTRIFDYAIRETGATSIPVMVGDNPDTDIMGALKAGWKAIWFNRSGKRFPFDANALANKGIDPAKFLGTAKDMREVHEILSGQH